MEQKRKIMIVEDDVIISQSLSAILRRCGFEICQLEITGEPAHEDMEKEKPDLVIMDILLAEDMDGVEAAKEIHSRHIIPIIFLTGYTDEEILEKARSVESSICILKPVDHKEILEMIDQSLRKKIEETQLP